MFLDTNLPLDLGRVLLLPQTIYIVLLLSAGNSLLSVLLRYGMVIIACQNPPCEWNAGNHRSQIFEGRATCIYLNS